MNRRESRLLGRSSAQQRSLAGSAGKSRQPTLYTDQRRMTDIPVKSCWAVKIVLILEGLEKRRAVSACGLEHRIAPAHKLALRRCKRLIERILRDDQHRRCIKSFQYLLRNPSLQ